MNRRSCFFIGSRHSPNTLEIPLTKAIEKHIFEYGVTVFTVGHYGNFDTLARNVLRLAKKEHENVELYLLAPYALNQKREVPEGFDGTVYPEGLETVPYRYAIVQANRYMVKHSDYLIAYSGLGNSRNLIEYALKREKEGLIKVTLL